MPIKKKSIDTLKQQKINFVNYIKSKEKYSKAIWDLFFDNEIEKIDNMDDFEKYLEEKWFSKELIGSLEEDYASYLKWKNFYWPKVKYTDEATESIRSNDKILNKLKNNIVSEYNSIKGFISLDIKKYVDEKFWIYDKKEFRDIKKEISNLNKDINKLKNEVNNLEKNNLSEEHNVFLKKTKLNWLNIFQFSKKKKLRKAINDGEQKIEENKWKIEELLGIINKKQEEHEKLMKLDNEIKLKLTSFDNIKDLFWWKNLTDKKSCETSIKEIISELSDYCDYISENSIKIIKSFISDSIFLNLKEKKNNIVKMINSYLNYFYFWEDRNKCFVIMRYWDISVSLGWILPTIYSKDKIDTKINNIINDLWWKININDERIIDRNFIDDIFIHTTWFNVLDEILNEWWLISTNEAYKRSKESKYYNRDTWINDIENSITQIDMPHKDIYFSRWFRENWYGTHDSENSDDYIFIVNTMSNFANSWYWIPLNSDMQDNPWFALWDSSHDPRWYSIISKSALEDKQNGYSRIDMKDFYIFIPETKKREIENNPKYKTNGANIIYFPEKFKWRMSYELYEFIKNEIALRENNNDKKTPVPRKFVNSIDNICDIGWTYEWAFCEKIDDDMEYNFNPLKWSEDQLLIFLKNESMNNIAYNGIDIDFEELKNFLSDQSSNIENIKMLSNFPKELVALVIICSKLWLWESWDWRWKRRIADICEKLGTFWYSSKEVWIVYKTVDWIWEFKNYLANNNKTLIKDLFDNRIKGWCKDWNIDLEEMVEFLKQSILITRNKRMSDWLLKDVF